MTTRPEHIVRPTTLTTTVARRVSTGEPLGILADVSSVLGLQNLRVHLEVLPPGRRQSPSHYHSRQDELAYVLEGSPVVEIDGERFSLAPGDIVGFAAGTPRFHSLRNESTTDVKLLVVSSVAGDDTVQYLAEPLLG